MSKNVLNVFISYKRGEGSEFIKKCIEYITKCCHTVSPKLSCQIAYDDNFLKAGDDFWTVAEEYYNLTDMAILIVTPEVSKSVNIHKELGILKEKGKRIVPVIFGGDFCDLPDIIKDYQAVCYSDTASDFMLKAIDSIIDSKSKKASKDFTGIVRTGFKTIIVPAVKAGISEAARRITVAAIIIIALSVAALILGKQFDLFAMLQNLF